MTRRFALSLAVLAIAALALPRPASALDDADFAPPVANALKVFVLPSYERLDQAANGQRDAMASLCSAPDDSSLDAARAAFADLVDAFSRVEMFRFGPARIDNRFDRLFFWPDRRSRGLKQVQDLLAEQDSNALTVEGLVDKSVAVQGLLALEYVLHGKDSEALATETGFRCRYGETIAAAIALHAGHVLHEWRDPGGYADGMRNTGPDNPAYKNHAESFQALLKAAAEMLEIVKDAKLGAAIGEDPETAKPKRAPFWRSDLTLAAMAANVEAVNALHDALGVGILLPEEWLSDPDQVRFELDHAASTLEEVDSAPGDFVAAVADADVNSKLRYVIVPLGSAGDILTSRYPAALGLALGFNSLDGD